MLLEKRTKRQPCPFYKSIEKLARQDVELHGYVQHYKKSEGIEGC